MDTIEYATFRYDTDKVENGLNTAKLSRPAKLIQQVVAGEHLQGV